MTVTLDEPERRMLGLIAQGLTCTDIAGALGCSVESVDSRRRSVMRKLGIDNQAALARFALREGLVRHG